MEPQLPRTKPARPPAAAAPDEKTAQVNSSTPVPESPEDFFSMTSTRIIPGANPPAPSGAVFPKDETEIHVPKKPKEISTLGEYQLLRKIGQGAMGAVYKARQVGLNRQVALKVLFPHIASNPKLVERLRREGLAMGQLDHPNLVSAYGIGEDQGWHYIAMEYVRGESLQKWIDRLGKLPLGDALHIGLAVASALEYAHNLGLVHRDIKPDNILITRDGKVKVTDLGMVKTADEDMSLTQTGHAVGTPWYMPLEQARNAKETDGRCDIYALGCMIYCMITGHPPFTGKTLVDVIQAKELGSFPPARQFNHDVPERLDLVLIKMTAKIPRYRYANCTELIKDLKSLELASPKLSFLEQKPVDSPSSSDISSPPPALPAESIDFSLDEWYLRVLQPDGKIGVRKLVTSQLKKMLEEGTVVPTAVVSHHPEEGFRAIATYKEFQSTALVQASRRCADQQAARYRNLYRKIEEKDRIREESERRAEDQLPDYSHLWVPAVTIGGIFVLVILICYFLFNLI